MSASFTDGEAVTGSNECDEEYDEEEESYEVDPDYLFAYGDEERMYCKTCHCSMSGGKTFEAHIAGARHKKNLKTSELGAPVRPNRFNVPTIQMKDGRRVNWKPKCQAMIDKFEKPLIGLQFVTEWCHRNRFVEPRYFCAICKAKCDVRVLTLHLTGVTHRVAYMKLFFPDMAEIVRMEGRKTEQAPMAELYAKKIEEKEGRQPLRVKVEGFENCEGDDDDKELEEFITANKKNFYRHLIGQGQPSYSESRKPGGSHGGFGSPAMMGSSVMSRSLSGVGFSGSCSASGSGYDSMGLNNNQMSFDSYQPLTSAMSGPMSQSRPHYNEDSGYRGKSSPGYSSGHSSAGYSGHLGGYGGHLGGYGGHLGGYSGHLGDNGGHLGDNGGHLGDNGGHLGDNGGHLGGYSGHLGDNGGHLGDNGGHLGGYSGHLGGNGGHLGGYGGQSSDYAAHQPRWHEDDTGFNPDRFQSDMSSFLGNSSAMQADCSFKPPFPSYSADLESGPSYATQRSRSSGRPYPADRPSRFPPRGDLSEDHVRYQSRY